MSSVNLIFDDMRKRSDTYDMYGVSDLSIRDLRSPSLNIHFQTPTNIPISVQHRFTRHCCIQVFGHSTILIVPSFRNFILMSTFTAKYKPSFYAFYYHDLLYGRKEFNIVNWTMVNIKLLPSEEKDLNDYVDEFGGSFEALVDSLLSYNYKVGFSFSAERNSYICTVTGREDAPVNARTSMSSWSDDPVEALAMTSYKVNKICGGGEWQPHERKDSSWG